MTKNLENKTKRTIWENIKFAAKVGTIASFLMQPAIQNIGSYIKTNNDINSLKTEDGKKYFAEFEKEVYNDRGFVGKTLNFGNYLAADNYLKKH